MSRKHIQYRTIFSNPKKTTNREEFPDQLIIRVGKACNFRCIFCNVAENESVLSLRSSVKEILAITFYKIKYSKIVSNHINITISGGEPSIFQNEVIFILKYFTTYFKQRNIFVSFDLQSNASNIDEAFARKLVDLGVTKALISSHAHDPDVFEKIIGVKYSVMGPKFESGVSNLIQAGIPITFNIILNKLNKDHYKDHIMYLMEKYPSVTIYNIGFVQPHGMAQENFGQLFVQYSEISAMYSSVIAYLKFHGKQVHSHLVGPPLCHMDDWGSSMEYMHNKNLIARNGENQTLILSINDDNKSHPSACNQCMAKRVCSGVWKEYADVQVLKPYKYLLNKGEKDVVDIVSLRKLYDGGKRQFLFDATDISTEVFYLMQSWGYVWISIAFSKLDKLDSVDRFKGMNIQISSDHPDLIFIAQEIFSYNNKTASQFRIQLDILFHSLQNWTIQKVVNLPRNSDIAIHLPKQAYKIKSLRLDGIYFSF